MRQLFFPGFSSLEIAQCTAVVEDCSHNPRIMCSNLLKNLFHSIKISFFENFLRGPYFVGFQTKWKMTPLGTNFNAMVIFLMSFWCSLDFHWPYCGLGPTLNELNTQYSPLGHVLVVAPHILSSALPPQALWWQEYWQDRELTRQLLWDHTVALSKLYWWIIPKNFC